jgi:Secretion system C-terminal sorting domain
MLSGLSSMAGEGRHSDDADCASKLSLFFRSHFFIPNKLHIFTYRFIKHRVMRKLLFMISFLFLTASAFAHLPASAAEEVYSNPLLKEFMVYPNPTSGALTLTMETFGETQTLQLKVYSLIGQEMYTESISPFAGVKQLSLDLSKFPKGIYMVEVTNGERSKMKRVSVI